MKKLVLQKAVVRELLDLPPKPYRRVVSAIFDLLIDPEPHYSRPLAGSPFRRIGIGEYRVIYRLDGDDVVVPMWGKRNDDEVYRLLERKM